jgi:hypothetical protein
MMTATDGLLLLIPRGRGEQFQPEGRPETVTKLRVRTDRVMARSV